MRKLITCGLVVIALSCVPGNGPIRALGTFQLTPECTVDEKIMNFRGLLDLSGNGTYLLDFKLISELSQGVELQSSAGTTLTTGGQNNWIADELVLTYTAKDLTPAPTFEVERIAIFGVIAPGQEAHIFGNIIGPKALQKLKDTVSTDPSVMPRATLNVKVEIKGHLESGNFTPMISNAFTFPITVINTNQMCMAGVALNGPCGSGGGQDSATVACCTGPGAPLGCP